MDPNSLSKKLKLKSKSFFGALGEAKDTMAHLPGLWGGGHGRVGPPWIRQWLMDKMLTSALVTPRRNLTHLHKMFVHQMCGGTQLSGTLRRELS